MFNQQREGFLAWFSDVLTPRAALDVSAAWWSLLPHLAMSLKNPKGKIRNSDKSCVTS